MSFKSDQPLFSGVDEVHRAQDARILNDILPY